MLLSIHVAYLVIGVEGLEIGCVDQPPYLVVAQANPVVEVAKPDDCIVIFDGPITLEP